jgi:uncharacterized alkaline shock family protein YloU
MISQRYLRVNETYCTIKWNSDSDRGGFLMTLEWRTELGQVTVSNEVIQRLAGAATVGCEGLVGMSSKAQLKDGIAELLGLENLSRGVVVHNQDGNVSVDLYIIIEYGRQLSAIAKDVQDRVYRSLHDLMGLEVSGVNVYVQGVRLPDKSREPVVVNAAD